MSLIFFDIKHAINVHDEIIDKTGGLSGVINLGLLQSVLVHVKNDEYYPLVEDKVTHLCYSINKNHSFKDGNKRSSIALSAYFLELNSFDYMVRRFIIEMENIAVDIAEDRINKKLLFEIIHSILTEEDYSEELKLKILQAKSA